jgi:hypothetical protein
LHALSSRVQQLSVVRTYLDDLLVISSTSAFEDPLEKMEVVLTLLSDKLVMHF